MTEKTKVGCYRLETLLNQRVSIHQLAKEHQTTYQSARKWLLENGIKIHKIGNSAFIWSNDLLRYLEMPFCVGDGLPFHDSGNIDNAG